MAVHGLKHRPVVGRAATRGQFVDGADVTVIPLKLLTVLIAAFAAFGPLTTVAVICIEVVLRDKLAGLGQFDLLGRGAVGEARGMAVGCVCRRYFG